MCTLYANEAIDVKRASKDFVTKSVVFETCLSQPVRIIRSCDCKICWKWFLRIFTVQSSSKADLPKCHKKYIIFFIIVLCYIKDKSMFLFVVAFLIMVTRVHIMLILKDKKFVYSYLTLNVTRYNIVACKKKT